MDKDIDAIEAIEAIEEAFKEMAEEGLIFDTGFRHFNPWTRRYDIQWSATPKLLKTNKKKQRSTQ